MYGFEKNFPVKRELSLSSVEERFEIIMSWFTVQRCLIAHVAAR